MTKRMPPRIPKVASSALPEASQAEILDDIRHETPTGTRDLDALKPHPSPSRPLDPQHVLDLARSIEALGLIHPVVIDVEDVVVAGSHRYAALRILQAHVEARPALLAELCPAASSKVLASLAESTGDFAFQPSTVDFARIPVRILPLSQRTQPEEAWRAEVAENERRKDYSTGEVKALAEKLRAQGYSFGKGRGGAGADKALPVLAAVVGRSTRQIRRILNDEPTKGTSVPYSVVGLVKGLEKFQRLRLKQLSHTEHAAVKKVIDILEKHGGAEG